MTIRLNALLAAGASALALLMSPIPSLGESMEDTPGFESLPWSTGVKMLPSGGVTVPAHARALTGTDIRTFLSAKTTTATRRPSCALRDWARSNISIAIVATRWHYARLGREVVGFARPPAFDRSHAMILYMLRVRVPALANAFEAHALILGRSGYESLDAGALSGNAADTWTVLQAAIAALSLYAWARICGLSHRRPRRRISHRGAVRHEVRGAGPGR